MYFLEFISVYLLGAVGYGSLEILWRGHTHWSMLLLGGLCFYLIYLISTRMAEPLWKALIMCGAVVTSLEFAVGCLVNLRLGWDVWDYSDMPLNLMGQICPAFCTMWLLLSVPCIYLSRFLYKYVFLPNFKSRSA